MPDQPRPIGVSATRGLTARDLSAVQELADTVRAADGVVLKLNEDLMDAPPGSDIDNFCYYDGDRLVGVHRPVEHEIRIHQYL